MISRSRLLRLPCAALVCRLVVLAMVVSASSRQKAPDRAVGVRRPAVLGPDAPSRQLLGDRPVCPTERPPLSHVRDHALLGQVGLERLPVRGQLAPHRDLAGPLPAPSL